MDSEEQPFSCCYFPSLLNNCRFMQHKKYPPDHMSSLSVPPFATVLSSLAAATIIFPGAPTMLLSLNIPAQNVVISSVFWGLFQTTNLTEMYRVINSHTAQTL